MARENENWYPGSFTKNFSWGPEGNGLQKLHETIRIGFDGETQDVPRDIFRERVRKAGLIEFIPANFFLFNKRVGGVDYIIADELVFHAISFDHSPRFDKLGLFAFIFSYAGSWKKAKVGQRWPALWAFFYLENRVAHEFAWNTQLINANDIEQFVKKDLRYQAKTARKLATNLNYLFKVGHLSEYSERRVEQWWVDALFLALDRLIEDRLIDQHQTTGAQYSSILARSHFSEVSGQKSTEKELAEKHLISLYDACGGRERFSPEHTKERIELKLGEIESFLTNDTRPQGAIHPTNPRILKGIPRTCAMLARYAGFDIIDADELLQFNSEEYVAAKTKKVLESLREKKITPTMSVSELMKLTRDK